ncbi:uncharacterized protein LOC134215027 [Armigeres subalbatus]|uniref:uncharacterized protein LOC134215027 n=1 Tax=Armigeres subalbatus TaxID=124917 RepID=UPI002ED3AB51
MTPPVLEQAGATASQVDKSDNSMAYLLIDTAHMLSQMTRETLASSENFYHRNLLAIIIDVPITGHSIASITTLESERLNQVLQYRRCTRGTLTRTRKCTGVPKNLDCSIMPEKQQVLDNHRGKNDIGGRQSCSGSRRRKAVCIHFQLSQSISHWLRISW